MSIRILTPTHTPEFKKKQTNNIEFDTTPVEIHTLCCRYCRLLYKIVDDEGFFSVYQ